MFAVALALSLLASPLSGAIQPVAQMPEPAATSATPISNEQAQLQFVNAPAAAPALDHISVRLECTALRGGSVSDCLVLEESRPGLGFGDAAVALMNGSPADVSMFDGAAAQVKFQRTIEFTP